MRRIVLGLMAILVAAGGPPRTAASTKGAAGSETGCDAGPEFQRRVVALVGAADAALVERDHATARRCGEELLGIVEQCPASPDGLALHEGHRILDHVALSVGDVAAAKRHLIEAGRTHGSASLNTFGPRFSLATELLARGEDDAVIEYLRLCSRFWKGRHKAIALWIARIRSGERPKLTGFVAEDGQPEDPGRTVR
jgi:hypothetical protein